MKENGAGKQLVFDIVCEHQKWHVKLRGIERLVNGDAESFRDSEEAFEALQEQLLYGLEEVVGVSYLVLTHEEDGTVERELSFP